jgi:hypothetical protein
VDTLFAKYSVVKTMMVFLAADVVLQVLNLCDTKSQSSCQYYVHCCIPRSVVELDVVGGDISMSFSSSL